MCTLIGSTTNTDNRSETSMARTQASDLIFPNWNPYNKTKMMEIRESTMHRPYPM